MADARDPVKKKCDIDDNITSHGASKVVAVELNKKLPKAKENEQDSIPSDDEDGYPDLHLDPDVIAQRKRDRKNKKESIENIIVTWLGPIKFGKEELFGEKSRTVQPLQEPSSLRSFT
ncbi:Hypothetical predicted protein [Mytilus galloprovincialis]|uniref:Uncharacterized protein n=1 Tax=Mytilus galloprovincialis TaxID=29158 RepID=A0A8B6BEL9_MYTGA|nr:Hypothetical predicted protein [Mytilus galloprovincialis]